MEIIVDGYNLIGASALGLRGNIESQRNRLIDGLSRYAQAKGFAVTVVFDGWRSGFPDEVKENRGAITVVYSRRGEKADSVVVRIARASGSGCVVVTSDREVRSAVERFGATAIYAGEFASILRRLEHGTGSDNSAEQLEHEGRTVKKGNSKQLSKTEKRRREKLKKLRI
ncbi:MAG TPA: NYN domain-containing protein [Candidatus Eisenbacteria bacterium]|nr:NYN domain-containing protein [Candidatus Eisenbacteria bacterium]